jgi:hypothetical protein
MAQTLAFTLPKMSAVGATMPVTQAFRTTRTGADRLSDDVQLMAVHFDDKARCIRAMGSDGKLRQCNIDRLPSLDDARQLWKRLQTAGQAGVYVKFIAAGGFSPDRWFYTIEESVNETFTL